jgi:hypothetical protein
LAAFPLAAGGGALAQRAAPFAEKALKPALMDLAGEAGQIRLATSAEKQVIHDTRRAIRANMPARPKYADAARAATADLLENGIPYHGSSTGKYPRGGQPYSSTLEEAPRTIVGKMGEPQGISLSYSPDLYSDAGMFTEWPEDYYIHLYRKEAKLTNLANEIRSSPKFRNAVEGYQWKYGHLPPERQPPIRDYLYSVEPKVTQFLEAVDSRLMHAKYQRIHPPMARTQVIWRPGVRPEDQIIDEITPEGKKVMRQAYVKALDWAMENPSSRRAVLTTLEQNIIASDMNLVPMHNTMLNAWEVGLHESGNMRKFNQILTKQLEDQGYIGILYHPHRGWKYMKEWLEMGAPKEGSKGLTMLQHGERELKIFDSKNVMHIDLRDWNDRAINRMWNKELLDDTDILQQAGISEKYYRKAGSGRLQRLHEARESRIDPAMDPSMAGNYSQIDLNSATIQRMRKYWTQADQQEMERILSKRMVVTGE